MKKTIEGKIQGNERGFAFLLPTEGGEDYFISHGDLNGAMHGDTVLAISTNGSGERTCARVLKILERGFDKIVGTYFTKKANGFVVPDDKRYFDDIYIPFGKGVRAKSGDKVVCKILTYHKRSNPEGIVVEVLGRQFEKNAELKAIEFSFKLKDKFPKQVTNEVEGLSDKITKDDLKGRKDFTGISTITIDGEDARDFDDAVSIQKFSGGYLLGVHIADVSHYVKRGSLVDGEAFERATSVYFPEKVIPMLPERLCNDLCSLRQGVERLTLSCVMKIDKSGKVIDSEITPSVIRSRARMTYSEVQKILDSDKTVENKHGEIVEDILLMNELTEILIKRREKEGCINIDAQESAITVSKKGVISVVPAPQDRAHKIIEEFMVLANTVVAEFVYYLEKPFVYRIHEKPSEEKLNNFYDFLKRLGINVLAKKGEVHSKDFQLILENSKDTPYYSLINRVMLRSMQKAKYAPNDVGHFGLSLKHYCHFTSPIRRYPDLVVHRILKDVLSCSQDLERKYGKFVFDASKQSSEKERNAMEAERAVDDYYKMLYISNYVGEEFDGVVSGVTRFGLFVELNNFIEGLVKIETIKGKGKKLMVDEKNYTMTDGKNTYKLGQKVKIKVVGVNVSERKAEFMLVNS